VDAMADPIVGKDGTFYLPYPILGLSSNGGRLFLSSGGGGKTAAKELPNEVQAHVFDGGKLTTVAAVNTKTILSVNLSHAGEDTWLGSAQDSSQIFELDMDGNTIINTCTWVTETKPSGRDGRDPPLQNFSRSSPTGDVVATGGTDGALRLWKLGATPALLHECDTQEEVQDADFSGDGKLVASCDAGGVCRIWSTESGKETMQMTYPVKGMNCRFVRFVTVGVEEKILVVGQGPRGPAYIGLFNLEGKTQRETLVNKKPLTSLATASDHKRVAVACGGGEKVVLSLPSLKVLKKTKPVHDFPAGAITFLEDGTVVTGGGDRILHLLRVPLDSGGSWCSTLLTFFTMLVFLWFLLHLGLKGNILGQGIEGEL